MRATSLLILGCVAVTLAQDLRLVDNEGSTGVSSGRVEVFRDGVWGTACSPRWGMKEATRVCADLGFPGATGASIGGEAPAYQPIWKDMVSCNGTEDSFAECMDAYDGDDVFQCGHDVDGYATCKTVRLALKHGGYGTTQGRVEVYMNGEWGTVCSSGFDQNDATMVCAQVLSSSATAVRYYGYTIFGEGSGPIHLAGLQCRRIGPTDVADIFSCPSGETNQCNHRDDVGVVCKLNAMVLVDAGGNPTTSRGRIALGRSRNSVCDRLFGQVDGDVVCKEIGYPMGAMAVKPAAFFGQGTGNILVDGSACTESDKNFFLCQRFPEVLPGCSHERDVGVICHTGVRLVAEDGSMDGNAGRLEVLLNNQWGTVCQKAFNQLTADVACRILGFNLGASSFGGFQRADGIYTVDDFNRPIAISGLYCRDQTASLLDCSRAASIDDRCSFRTNVMLTCNAGVGKREEFLDEQFLDEDLKEFSNKETLLSRVAELLATFEDDPAI